MEIRVNDKTVVLGNHLFRTEDIVSIIDSDYFISFYMKSGNVTVIDISTVDRIKLTNDCRGKFADLGFIYTDGRYLNCNLISAAWKDKNKLSIKWTSEVTNKTVPYEVCYPNSELDTEISKVLKFIEDNMEKR